MKEQKLKESWHLGDLPLVLGLSTFPLWSTSADGSVTARGEASGHIAGNGSQSVKEFCLHPSFYKKQINVDLNIKQHRLR